MTILDAARALLERHGVTSAWDETRSLQGQVAALEQQLAAVKRLIPWWDRLAFFSDTVDEKRAAELNKQLAEARSAAEAAERRWDEALSTCRQELPPLEVVDRAARLCLRAASNPWLARGGKGGDELAAALEELAERTRSVWFPDVDRRAIAELLWDDAGRAAAAAADPGPLQADPRLGWAPITHAELSTRAARALSTTGFAGARARLSKEHADWTAASQRLEQARAQVTLTDTLIPGPSVREQNVAVLRQALSTEEQEVVHAQEEVHLAISRALSSHPMMRVHDAALACAAVLRVPAPCREGQISAGGAVIWQPTACGRAVLWTAVTELRNACEAAFPGLPDLAWPRSGAELSLGPLAQLSPYRQAAVVTDDEARDAEQQAPRGDAFGRLETHSMPAQLQRALAHAVALGDIERQHRAAEEQVSLLDRMIFWSASDAERAARQWEQRQRWHHALLDGLTTEALYRVEAAMGGEPLFALRRAIVTAAMALRAIRTHEGSSSSSRTCPVIGQAEALGAAHRVASCLSQRYGPGGTRRSFADAVEQRLLLPASAVPRPDPRVALDYPELVDLAASELRSTAFVQHRQHARQAGVLADQAQLAANQADATVSLLDRVNIFSDSEAERQRNAQLHASKAQRDSAWGHHRAAEQLLDRAMRVYPPAVLYYALEQVTASIAAIRAEQRRHTSTSKVGNRTVQRTYYTCELLGKQRTCDAFRRWTQWVLQVFGPLPSAGELLERYAARDL